MQTLAAAARMALLTSTALCLSLAAPAPAMAQGGADTDASEQGKEYNIPASDMGKALDAYAEQADVEIIYSDRDVAGKLSNGVHGTYARDAALDELIGNSGLKYTVNEDGVVVIQAASLEVKEAAAERPPMRMAEVGKKAGATRVGGFSSREIEREERQRDELVVTGTNIRGAAPIGSPFFQIDREEIDRTGLSTTAQIIQSLPQNFGGGINEDTGNANQDGGSGVNLRGLGNVATLTLLNGRRIPVGGTTGDYTDISNIPASLIERIEVLPDGASAIYGADAIAGVVNIILRDDFDGAETRLRYGTVTKGNLQEYQVSQTLGTKWRTGNVIAAYEYYDRDPLAGTDRAFTASSDLTAFGGDNFNDFRSNPGNILDPETGYTTVAFAIPENQDGTALTVGELLPGEINEGNRREGSNLLPSQKRHSVFAAVSQKLNESVALFMEGNYSRRNYQDTRRATARTLIVPSSNPFFVDPFGGSSSVHVDYNFADDLGPTNLTGNVEDFGVQSGFSADLWADWRIRSYGVYSKRIRNLEILGDTNLSALNVALADSNPSTAFNPFGDGSNTNPATLALILLKQSTRSASTVAGASSTLDGGLFSMPGGEVRLALGFEYRDETLGAVSTRSDRPTSESFKYGKHVNAYFGEIQAPLFSNSNKRTGFESLILSGSIRHENYGGRVNASTTNPKFGALWSPVPGLTFRGSYGTSFRTPNLYDLDESGGRSGVVISTFPDPQSTTGTTRVLRRAGTNANLGNETATTWTLGLDYSPASIQSLVLNITYFDIAFKDRISSPSPFNIPLVLEDQYADIIIRNPTQAQLDELCNSDLFFSNPSECVEGVIGALIDARLNNTAATAVDGLDFQAAYGVDAGVIGRIDLRLNGTYLLGFDQRITPTSSPIELADTIGNPIDLQLRSSVTWSGENGLSSTVFVNYADRYRDNASVPERDIDSWTTIDFNIAYRTDNRLSNVGLNDLIFTVNVRNVFDSDPPFVNNGAAFVGYDPANADPLGRFISFNVVKAW